MKMLTCVECGEQFEQIGTYKKRFCSKACQSDNRKRIIRWNKKLKDKKPAKVESISDVQKLAKASGMSYGDYVAQEYKKKVKVIRKW